MGLPPQIREKNKMENYQSKLYDYKETGIKPFNWGNYNESQTKEKFLFFHLLKELLETVDKTTDQHLSKAGTAKSYYNQIFTMCLKVYTQQSSRRLISDLKIYKQLGFINKTCHFNTILNYFNNRDLRVVLQYLIELSAVPLAQLERKFAVDATGIGAHQFEPWSQIRSVHNKHRKYKKVHLIYGVLSNVAVACRVTKGTANDSPQFETLLKRCADNFDIEECSADMAYSSKANLQAVVDVGGVPYIPFKTNATGSGLGTWRKMYKYFKQNQEEFYRHYHLRSNAETGMFMIKKKFGEFVSSKSDVAQENEILCKVLCHNICCLIQEMFLQKLDVDFLKCIKRYNGVENG